MVNGVLVGMKLTIDKAARIVVPKPLRDRLGLKPDTVLEILERADGVLLRPVEQRPSMCEIDGLWVHQETAVAPDARWAQVLDDVREERLNNVLKG